MMRPVENNSPDVYYVDPMLEFMNLWYIPIQIISLKLQVVTSLI